MYLDAKRVLDGCGGGTRLRGTWPFCIYIIILNTKFTNLNTKSIILNTKFMNCKAKRYRGASLAW